MGKRLPLTHTHWGAYRVTETDGSLAVSPFEGDPDPSPIGASLAAARENRVARPSIRRSWLEQGPGAATDRRGTDAFVEVSWETALELAAHEIDRVRRTYGNASIYGGSYGWSSAGRFHHAQTLLRRFLTGSGGYTDKVNTYSHAAGEVLLPHVLGLRHDQMSHALPTWPELAEHCGLVIAFGGIPLRTAQIQSGGVSAHLTRSQLEATAANGTRFVNISPVRDDLHEELNPEWVPCRPGSDTAIMLGMLHVLLTEDLASREFLTGYTTGWDQFERYVLGDSDGLAKSPSWAESQSGVPRDKIIELARSAAKSQTMVTAALSLQRTEFGEQPWWATIALACALGQIGEPGGGFGLGYGAFASVGNGIPRVSIPSLPRLGTNPVKIKVPVARVTDMLANPGGSYEYDGSARTYPDIKLVYWAGGNPFHHQQDLNKLHKAWENPDTIIINEQFWTTAARRADIVFPATTSLERNDIGGSAADDLLIHMEAVIEPYREARDDYAIFSGLAERLGFGAAFTQNRSADDWVEHLYNEYHRTSPTSPTWDEFRTEQYVRHSESGAKASPTNPLGDFRTDPERSPLGTPSGKIEIYSATIAGFAYPDCPGHPSWLEPTEWLGAIGSYPLHLITSQPSGRLHSQYDHGESSTATTTAGRETLSIHPQDASSRGLSDGDTVLVFNQRGSCLAGVLITGDLMPGVAVLPTGAWLDQEMPGSTESPCRRGNPNVLTRDIGTSSLSQGSSAHTCLVEVELVTDPPPPGSRMPDLATP